MKPGKSYAEKHEKKRWAVSVSLTAVLYIAVFSAGLLIGYLYPEEKYLSNITVNVNIPGDESAEPGLGSVVASEKGEEAEQAPPPARAESVPAPKSDKAEPPQAKTPEKPEPKTPERKPALAAQAPAPKQETPAAPPKKSDQNAMAAPPEKTAQSVDAQPAVPSPPIAEAKAPAPAAPAEAPVPWIPGERGPGSRVSGTNSSVYVPGLGEVPWSSGDLVTIRKAEKGNSMETKLGGMHGTVGQSLYVPISDCMPLPVSIPAKVFEAIPDQVQPPNTVIYTAQARKKAFLMYYEPAGASYRAKADIPVSQRGPLWQMLEDAGYDSANAEYKSSRTLAPVVIGFTVSKDRQLKGVEILQSSGDPEIDRLVLYGFKLAAFWNKTGETVAGRFIYRF